MNVARGSQEELLLDYEDYLRHRRLVQWDANSLEAREVRSVPWRFRSDRSDRSDQTDQTDRRADQTDRSDRTDHQSDLTHLTDRQRWELYAAWLEHDDPAVRANALICLIHQANYLLDRQILALEREFITNGGYSEQLATARLEHRRFGRTDRTDQSDRTDRSNQTDRTDRRVADLTDRSNTTDRSDPIPDCPKCSGQMALRTARSGRNAGRQFWGCTQYPECTGIVEL